MAGHEWDDWFEREELIGQISDIRVQNLQVEREVVQKRTFTRWMNLHLEKCNPPMEVRDLFRDIQDGRILMVLLEELSGCKLLHGFKPSSHRIFRLNNIAKVLTFLEERNVKLVSIDATDIADGNPSIVLGLIWNIILFFQIKELTGNIKSQFPSSSSLSSIPTSSDSDTSHSSTPSDERKPIIAPKGHGKVIKTLLQWVQRRTRKYGVAVQDFGKSWTSGLAFLAVIKSIDPSLVDMRRALLRSPRENIEEAFRTAHYSLGIPRLLEPEDVTLNPPDEQSIMIYVSQFLEHFPGIEEDETSDILERSKISARTNDLPVRNGVQRKREYYTVKRDLVQSPPKIFISSVSEDREQITSPVLSQPPEDRHRASEGSSMSSSASPADDKPLDLNKDVSTFSSPQPSFSDSAFNSPDSWIEEPSETTQQENTQWIKYDPTSKNIMAGERYSTTPSEMTSDLGSPFSQVSTSENQLDRELFIDQGSYSLGSIEEEDAYKYILDLNKKESDNHLPSEDMRNKADAVNLEQTETDHSEYQESDKPTSDLRSDSGYFQDHKEAMPAQPEGISKAPLITALDEGVGALEIKIESEAFQDNESSNTEAMHRNCLEFTDGPEEKPIVFKDETEPKCPVLQYERVSISSEEDIKLWTDLTEEHTAESDVNNLPNILNGHAETKEGLHDGEPSGLLESEEKKQIYNDHKEPLVVSDLCQIEAEVSDEDKMCYMCGAPVVKSLTESIEQYEDSDSVHLNELETGGNFKDSPRENDALNGIVSVLENKPGETKSMCRAQLIHGKSKLECASDSRREKEFSHNTNSESQVQVSDNKEPGGAKDNRPVSVIPRDVVDYDVPKSDSNIHEGDKNSSTSSPRHRPQLEVAKSEQTVTDQTSGGHSYEETTFIGVRPERRPTELRLALSVTPLQPAPPKCSLTESDTDTEDASEGHGKGFKQRKEQSPFDRHPGEWGTVEPDSPAEHCELTKTDEDLTGARENTGTLREEAVTDASQTLTTIHLRKVVDTSESKGQNGKAIDVKVNSTIINKSLENKTAASPESTYDITWVDIYILLASWIFVYCLFVLPQIDSQTLPKLLFNIDE
ncbi:interaptin-like isoform X2 [Myxocyprinus asiaticus]|uniref:interaptin-like isoform X2 n=1 Tax=Myxocyprinus asiaticus TaxID=70543 RepID=UPI002222BD72|nr:interaptin-like isoform X2 [Myxocyprinus asiaticus]